MIFDIVLVILVVIAIACFVNIVEDYRNKKSVMSFRESMDLAEMPVVTFYQGDQKFNFLLDTGSNLSHITEDAAKRLNGQNLDAKTKVSGIGTGETSGLCRTTLSYKDVDYSIDLCITNHLSEAFADIKAETGVQVHGLIGNQFFQQHKYVLDFKELIAYTK